MRHMTALLFDFLAHVGDNLVNVCYHAGGQPVRVGVKSTQALKRLGLFISEPGQSSYRIAAASYRSGCPRITHRWT
jgi:hypothetical protein